MAYSNKVIDHYENPRNVGSFDKSDDSVGTGMVGAPACGDVMKLQIKVNPDTGVIEDARFKTYGCGSAIASSSLVTEWVKGKTLDQAAALKNSEDVGTGLVGAPACGDVMKLQIKVGADGLIEDAKFKTFGCGSAIASSSLATEWVKGKTLDEAMTIKNTQIVEELNLPPVKIHCSVLAEDAIKAAIADYKAKTGRK